MKSTTKLFCSIFLLVFGIPALALAGSATLHWQANTESDLAGYRIYYGTSSRSYGVYIPVDKNTTSYTINNLTEGQTYYFALTAVDTSGNESGFSEEVSKSISPSYSPVSSVRLTSDLPSPQTAGTTVTFTASATGGSGNYEYCFWVRGPATNGRWSMVRRYATSPNYTMDTTNYVGTNEVNVWARNVGSSEEWEVWDSVTYEVQGTSNEGTSPVESVRLTCDLPSPQAAGTSVTFSASASGGSGNYEYCFWVRGPATGGRWLRVRDYSSSPTYVMDTANYVGVNEVDVWARNVGSSEEWEVSDTILFRIY